MKIAVFGATGIVGNAIVKEALKKGHYITVLTRDAKKYLSSTNGCVSWKAM